MKAVRLVVTAGATGVAGLLMGYWLGVVSPHEHTLFQSALDERELGTGYEFTNPLLACGDDRFPRVQYDALSELEGSLKQYIDAEKTAGRIRNASVFFRELNGVNSISINGGELFTPGSMLKVPLVMSVYAKAQHDPSFLERKLVYNGENLNALEHFRAQAIQNGVEYTVQDLIHYVLAYSDNNAAVLLLDQLSEQELHDAYARLGIRLPEYNSDYQTSVNVYASFFRILYNATYISSDFSEKTLKSLSESTFKDGLVAGIPSNIRVAHKFGERDLGDGNVQLHDCGIVYTGKQPYLLCVMMRGDQYAHLATGIASISRMAYEYAAARPAVHD